ncbi:MAG TPA: hypothetical protein VHO72_07895 [Bacteroidales bacterium]|nr:hypothetical protein [Bacteroidales bacterium]
MGFNISGIAINRNFKDNFGLLTEHFGWNLEFQEEITFETAAENWKEDSICDVFFTDKGTLLFASMERCIDPRSLPDCNVLSFALSETSMAFNLNYTENGTLMRQVMELEGKIMSEEGIKLETEQNAGDTSEAIWNLMERVIGCRFWDIDFSAKAYRYVFKASDNFHLNNTATLEVPEAKPDGFNSQNIIELSEMSDKFQRIRDGITVIKKYRAILTISVAVLIMSTILLIVSFFVDIPFITWLLPMIGAYFTRWYAIKKLEKNIKKTQDLGYNPNEDTNKAQKG